MYHYTSPKSKDKSDYKDEDTKRMSQLEKQIEALASRNNYQEMGITWPYPIEWGSVPYPPKFKASAQNTSDGKKSPN